MQKSFPPWKSTFIEMVATIPLPGSTMTIDWTRTLLLWDPEDERLFGFSSRDFESRGIPTFPVSYSRIGRDADLVRVIRERRPEALIFTRNDDMPGNPSIGPLLARAHTGYTSVSAIDPEEQASQTRQCMADLLRGSGEVSIQSPQSVPLSESQAKGTFCLIFDFEQFGGARFGMPRLLPLLESSGIKATFFVTGFMSSIFPGLMRRISDGGHEIGVHGTMHEFLQGRPPEEQAERIGNHVRELSEFGEIAGANFIYRMDEHSPDAIFRSSLRYFVLFRKHMFRRARFMEASCRSRPFRTLSGDLTLIPVSVETYGRERFEIKRLVDVAWKNSCEEGVHHISVLMHPFKDGCLKRIETTRWLAHYLMKDLQLRPITLSSLPAPQPVAGKSIHVGYRWDGYEAGREKQDAANHVTGCWWAPPLYHSRRTENLVDALNDRGISAVLAADSPPDAKRVRVYPDRIEDAVSISGSDPILNPRRTAEEALAKLKSRNSVVVSPPSRWRDLLDWFVFHVPRTIVDLRELAPKVWPKILRLIRGQH